MLSKIVMDKKVRLTFDSRFPIVATVAGVERNQDDEVTAVLLKTPQLPDYGTLYFEADEITKTGAQLDILEDSEPMFEEDILQDMAAPLSPKAPAACSAAPSN